ncbi:hypothetical protein BC941DRAFT_464812 [Chlamydoabsidia padenii]|nr:hypothetical protein BC941DRAFT_464812 [Chlamydoabsidia padenii]
MTINEDTELMSNRVAVVTGGCKGIGLAVATALIAREVKVVIGDIVVEKGQSIVSKFNQMAGTEIAVFQYCDVRKYDDLKELFQLAETSFGGVDIAIMSVSTGSCLDGILQGPLEDEAERFIHDVNVGGVIKGNKVALMHMVKRGGGCIINTACITGVVGGVSMSSYVATKHAIVGWTQNLEQLSVMNIRVNAVCPYWIGAKGHKQTLFSPNDDDRQKYSGINIMEASPEVPMHLIVDTFMACITNCEYAGKAIMVTPDGFHTHIQAELPEPCVSESMVQVLLEFYPKMNERNIQQLIFASESYFRKL